MNPAMSSIKSLPDKIAIDVVILPPSNIIDWTVRLSKGLRNKPSNKIALGRRDNIPHISLFQGVVEKQELKKIAAILEKIAKDSSIRTLETQSVDEHLMKNGDVLSAISIKKHAELVDLQKKIMKALRCYLTGPVDRSMLFKGEKANQSTLDWIAKYYSNNKNADKVYPHITLGFGKPSKNIKRQKFPVSTIAIYQLGNNCTCRKKICYISLK